MYDGELRTLAAQFGDLTEMAQQVLRDEMRKRALGDPLAPSAPPSRVQTPQALAQSKSPLGESDVSDLAIDYTWKTRLCECETLDQARQLQEILHRHGIESWLEGPRTSARWDLLFPRVLVAADQLDEAREIASRPVPPEIVDQSRVEIPEFQPLVCPRCGTPDPILDAVEPVNSWLCEACGKEWSDPLEDAADTP